MNIKLTCGIIATWVSKSKGTTTKVIRLALLAWSLPLMSNPVGRPPLFRTPEELQARIKEYFSDVPTKTKFTSDGTPYEVPCPTITGLTLFLGFCDRQSYYDYEQNKKEFTCTLKEARTFIEQHYEELLQTGNTVGAIFALKNFGWIDKVETDNKNSNHNVNETFAEYKARLEAEKQAAIKEKNNG